MPSVGNNREIQGREGCKNRGRNKLWLGFSAPDTKCVRVFAPFRLFVPMGWPCTKQQHHTNTTHNNNNQLCTRTAVGPSVKTLTAQAGDCLISHLVGTHATTKKRHSFIRVFLSCSLTCQRCRSGEAYFSARTAARRRSTPGGHNFCSDASFSARIRRWSRTRRTCGMAARAGKEQS